MNTAILRGARDSVFGVLVPRTSTEELRGVIPFGPDACMWFKWCGALTMLDTPWPLVVVWLTQGADHRRMIVQAKELHEPREQAVILKPQLTPAMRARHGAGDSVLGWHALELPPRLGPLVEVGDTLEIALASP